VRLRLEVEGQIENVVIQTTGGVHWFSIDGEVFTLPEESSRSQGKKGKGLGGSTIEAPMPGKVTKLLKAVGDSVIAGDIVLVMEAMKMEYSLKAEVTGTLRILDCKVGDQVVLGKRLCQFEVQPEATASEAPT